MSNVKFKGDDKFDLPQTGTLIKLHEDDIDRNYDTKNTYRALVGKKVMWAKYAEADCLIYDNELGKDVVLIALDKMRGYK